MMAAVLRLLAALLGAFMLSACAADEPEPIANYQFNAPVSQVAARLVTLAEAHSSLSRIGIKRPALRVQSSQADGQGTVTIAVPGGARLHPVTLTFALTPYLDGKSTMVALSVSASDMGEIDLGPQRFAGAKALSKDFAEALGMLASKINGPAYADDPARRFGRLFDLATVLDNPELRGKVERLGKQQGVVDFLFFDVPPDERFED